MKSFFYWFWTVMAALFGGAAMLAVSFFVTTDHDYTQEQTIGVITKRGLPIPYAFSSPGGHTDFSTFAIFADYFIFVVLLIFVIRALFPKK
jgi:hypothetical protein